MVRVAAKHEWDVLVVECLTGGGSDMTHTCRLSHSIPSSTTGVTTVGNPVFHVMRERVGKLARVGGGTGTLRGDVEEDVVLSGQHVGHSVALVRHRPKPSAGRTLSGEDCSVASLLCGLKCATEMFLREVWTDEMEG
ncbi:hypothetical protein E2C01_001584 [Portunus trituberculatus]|uniref:Uncharacterized protein n=1 Tax=Portunus trituberculatus TaxID=210409 RepID=A0A5B7CI62_PORTR|nr:hypothetical protein [Portunus trituberculatus]